MLLRNYLESYTRKQLIEEARLFELKNCSGLRKNVLIDRILECFCTEEFLRSRMACLTKEQMNLFRKACSAPQDISMDQIIDGMQLYRFWLGGFEDPTDQFCVYEEIAEIFQKIDDDLPAHRDPESDGGVAAHH